MNGMLMFTICLLLAVGIVIVYSYFNLIRRHSEGLQLPTSLAASSGSSIYNWNTGGTGSRYFLLLLICLIMLGSNAAYDSPSTLFQPLKHWLGTSAADFQYQFNMLYSIYAVPNIILPLYAGVMIDKYGFPRSLMTLLWIVATGVFTYCMGVQYRNFWWMFMGRLLLGIGSESLLIVQSGLATRYFLTSNLSFALSVTISATRLNTVLNYNFTPLAGELWGVIGASWVSFACCMVSLLCGWAIVRLDSSIQLAEPIDFTYALPRKKTASEISPVSPVRLGKRRQRANSAPGTPRLRNNTQTRQTDPSIDMGNTRSAQAAGNTFTLLLRRLPNIMVPPPVLQLSAPFWYLTGTLIAYSVCTISFLPVATAFLQAKHFPDDPVQAASLVALPDSLSFLIMPLIGLLADRMRHRTASQLSPGTAASVSALELKCLTAIAKSRQLVLSGVAITCAHLFFLLTSWSPEWNLIILGIGYAGFGSILYGLMAELVNMDYSRGVAAGELPSPDLSTEAQLHVQENGSAVLKESGDLLFSATTSPTANTNSINSTNNLSKPGSKVNSNKVTGNDEDLSKSMDSWVVSAYGTSACLVNATFSLSPIFVAWLIAVRSGEDGPGNDETLDKDSYFGMEVFFSCVGFIGILSSIMTEWSLRKQYLATARVGGAGDSIHKYQPVPVSSFTSGSLIIA